MTKDGKIKILHIMGCGDVGGISSVVLNYYNFIDRNRIHFDIALSGVEFGRDAALFQQMGSEVYLLPLKRSNCGEYKKKLKNILREGKYDAVHVHENQTSYVALKIAKKIGVKCRIAHSHTSAPCYSIRDHIRHLSGILINPIYATTLVACGKLAGERVFGKNKLKKGKALILPNAVDCEKYKYDNIKRENIRRSFGLEDCFVMIFVGRLGEEKNIRFAIDTAISVHKKLPKSTLIIAGEGEEREDLTGYINENRASEYIKLIGKRDDVDELLCGSDVLLLPSIHEGFPVVVVEAMSSGLRVVLSQNITSEFEGYNGIEYLPIDNSQVWADAVVRASSNNGCDRIKLGKQIENSKLNIRISSEILETLYIDNCMDE